MRVKEGSAVTKISGERVKIPVVAHQTPADRPLDCAGVLLRVGGDRALLEELTAVFRENCPAQLSQLREAVAADDSHTVERISHSLRGGLSNLGAIPASESAMRLEEMARRANLAGADSERVQLEREIVRAEEALLVLCHEVAR